jgi:hypothetical protein
VVQVFVTATATPAATIVKSATSAIIITVLRIFSFPAWWRRCSALVISIKLSRVCAELCHMAS